MGNRALPSSFLVQTTCRAGAAFAILMAQAAFAQSSPMFNESLPRLPLTDEAAVRMNRALAEADAAAADMRADCLSTGPGADWSRWVDVTFDGPRFLSVLASVDFYCEGAAHPNQFQTPMTFDRRTGQQVSWQDLLGGAKATGPDGLAVDLSPALRKAYLDAIEPVPPECLAPLTAANAFQIWLDGQQRSVAVKPVDLAYILRPCADIGYVPADSLEEIGASPDLLAELGTPTP